MNDIWRLFGGGCFGRLGGRPTTRLDGRRCEEQRVGRPGGQLDVLSVIGDVVHMGLGAVDGMAVQAAGRSLG